MSDDDLVKRLRTPMVGVTLQACFKERYEAADRIEELELLVDDTYSMAISYAEDLKAAKERIEELEEYKAMYEGLCK